MAAPGRKLNFRPRPIDIFKKLEIIRSKKGLVFDDEIEKGIQAATGVDSDEEAEVQVALAFTPGINPVDIPCPNFSVVSDYDPEKLSGTKFERNAAYIRFKAPEDEVEYEMDADDDAFLKRLAADKIVCQPDKFEMIVDKCEKESHRLGSVCALHDLDGKLTMRQNVIQAVHKYWYEKRKKFGNALIRRLATPTSINDLSPLSTFRPREKERVHRKTRRNDSEALNKLKQLRLDFDRSRTLLEVVTRREKLKKDMLILTFKIQNAELDQSWDFLEEEDNGIWPLAMSSKYHKVKSEKEKPLRPKKGGKSKPGLKVEGEDDIEGYCSSASTTTSSDWSDASDGPRSPGGLVRKRAGEPIEQGVVLPMTDDLKLSATSTLVPHRHRRLMGRGRVGRGGRIIFDRAMRSGRSQDDLGRSDAIARPLTPLIGADDGAGQGLGSLCAEERSGSNGNGVVPMDTDSTSDGADCAPLIKLEKQSSSAEDAHESTRSNKSNGLAPMAIDSDDLASGARSATGSA